MHLSFIIPENVKDLALIIPEILEFIELDSFKLALCSFNTGHNYANDVCKIDCLCTVVHKIMHLVWP